MVTSFHQAKQQSASILQRFTLFVIPSLLVLSTILTSCSTSTNQATTTTTSKGEAKSTTIKLKVVRLGYQTAGDIVKVKGVLEKRLEPLGVKVEWSQFAAG